MSSKQKIIVVDSFSVNNFHETFNSAFLLALKLSSKKKITYYASNSAIIAIKNLVKNNILTEELKNVDFLSLKLYKGTNSIAIFFRYFLSSFINLKKLLFSSKEDTLIFTLLNPFFVWPLQLLLLFVHRKVFVICHGELELPIKKSAIYKPTYFYKKLIHSFLSSRKINKQLKLIVLGDNIKQYLLTLYPNLKQEQLKVIDHPSIFKQEKNKQEIRSTNKLIIGTVGAVSMEKGFTKLVELSNLINKERVCIHVVGSYHFNIDNYKNIHFVSKNGLQLPTQTYKEGINRLDFVLFLFHKNSYKLTVSGAVFDAINLNKPIIAIKNSYFESIFNLYGPIGYLCNDVSEIQQIIDNLNKDNDYKEQYVKFTNNIHKLKEHYSYKSIALQLHKLNL
ncbi:glycosyltransferase involved in cell wall biosynthesis [Wenyingzhuangia heitensis]|uniref:Glycosyltransferase involved in cell wall biosynthesis n=1 Tax=Wenyingzhuangia heitensis TaxID=1487859 RepID=A0ABX0UAY0_9FLAO|nr:glycosyltransferase [Wenyingzhuangia heitensis]NIJ44311.1 glycosyltransferase involved in cell wall biosynthesis [Wenyingzhuangia heitensis]